MLLESNPLNGTEALARIAGVCLRGLWLDHGRLAEMRTRLAEIFSEDNVIPDPSPAAFEAFVAEAGELSAAGWPYPGYMLEEMRQLLGVLGYDDLVAELPAG